MTRTSLGMRLRVLGENPRAVALLHSFWWREGEKTFRDVLERGGVGNRIGRKRNLDVDEGLRRLVKRGILGKDLIVTHPGGYQLAVEPDQVDVVRFERLLAKARGATAAKPRR